MTQKQKTSSWKSIRVVILFVILALVLLNVWRDKNQDWQKPIFVALYPVNADQSAASQKYIAGLKEQDYLPIANYLQQEAKKHDKQINVYFKLGQEVKVLPPQIPASTSVPDIMLWSLKFRYYALQQKQNLGMSPQLTLFLNYYDANTYTHLKHSTALENGRIGIVNLFASQNQESQNQIVIAHEMLHAFGATDKYDLSTGQPISPIGYGNPFQQPRYPQKTAELMAGRIALSPSSSKMADDLKQVVVGYDTGDEIGWHR